MRNQMTPVLFVALKGLNQDLFFYGIEDQATFVCSVDIPAYNDASQNVLGVVFPSGSLPESPEVSWLAAHANACDKANTQGPFFMDNEGMIWSATQIYSDITWKCVAEIIPQGFPQRLGTLKFCGHTWGIRLVEGGAEC